jgi:translation initiation factor IF-2
MRVYDLARELGIANKDLLARLRAQGIEVASHSSSISDEAVRLMRSGAAPAAPAAAPSPSAPAPVSAAAPSKPVPAKTVPPPPPPAKPAAPAKPTPSNAPVVKPAVSAKPVPPAAAKPSAPAKPVSAPVPAPVPPPPPPPPPERKTIVIRGGVVVRTLAEQMGLKPNQLIAELMAMNVFASINARVDLKVAQQVAEKHGFTLEHEKKAPEVRAPAPRPDEDDEPDDPADLVVRPPIVTFMGHIDHGKTSLLDRIRNAGVAKKEAGGITQHIGAYTLDHHGKPVTFLDTPGHKAFTAMRARGANLTDIVVLVVAADDGIMPQTEEAIQHSRAAKTTLMVAINKVDLPTANVDRVKQQLQALGLTPEDWGGEIICCPVSAATGQGVEHLLEMIHLQADMLELRANPKRRCRGYVIESRLEPGMGPTATLMVMRGTLSVGDVLLCGPYWGRVKALMSDQGLKVRTAGPAIPVKCLGLSGAPQAGEEFRVCANDRLAREQAEQRLQEARAQQMVAPRKVSLEDLMGQADKTKKVELKLILKADTHGSIEAIQRSLEDIRSEKVALSVVLAGVGNVTENDVLLASASDAVIFGFNVSKEPGVLQAERHEGVEVRLYSIIYEILDDIKQAMSGLLAPEIRERQLGRAEVKQIFEIGKKGNIAGCLVVSGRIAARARVRVKRQNAVVFEGAVATLKHFQESVAEMREGQECGIRLDGFDAYETGDALEFYEVEKIAAKL